MRATFGQGPVNGNQPRLTLRVEADKAQAKRLRLAWHGTDTVSFSESTLLTGADFVRLVMQDEGATSFSVVGVLTQPAAERIRAQNSQLVGKRVGVIVDGHLVGLWRIERPIEARFLPLASGYTKSAATVIAQSVTPN
jgi:hypothetical protein